ncbi:MAG: endonuclease V [Methanocellales archaeon]|nr:endonuclease V [Methanocellales archaeon]
MADQAIVEDRFETLKGVAGVDQAFFDDKVISGIVVLDYETMDALEKIHSIEEVDFPYIPTFLSFREGPAIVSAFRTLKNKPDLLMVDGCGINHPRRAGLATHVGVALDTPTIGVAKRLLCGVVKTPTKVDECNPILLDGKHVGASLLSKSGCNPIYIAPGHRVSLRTTIKIVKHCLRGYKLPEPIRVAHEYVGRVSKRLNSGT